MIPIVFLAGLVVGRWWYIPAASAVWVALAYSGGMVGSVLGALGAAAFAAINATAALGLRALFVQSEIDLRPATVADRVRRPDTTTMASFLRIDPSA